MKLSMRRRIAGSGRRPREAPRLSMRYATGLLPFAKGAELCLRVPQVVHCDQIDLRRAQALERLLHLLDPGIAALGSHLRCDKQRVSIPELGHEVTYHRLGVTIRRRGVDDFPSEILEPTQHLFELRAFCLRRSLVAPRRPDPDDRHALTAGRDLVLNHGALLGEHAARGEKKRRSHTDASFEQFPTTQSHDDASL